MIIIIVNIIIVGVIVVVKIARIARCLRNLTSKVTLPIHLMGLERVSAVVEILLVVAVPAPVDLVAACRDQLTTSAVMLAPPHCRIRAVKTMHDSEIVQETAVLELQ